jgi:hypothetical protein
VESTDEKKPLATAIPVATLPNTSQQSIRKGGIACVSGLNFSLLATATASLYHSFLELAIKDCERS